MRRTRSVREDVMREPIGGTPEAMRAFVQKEAALWKKAIADVGIKPE
jgi:hypothetical protein